MSKASLDDFGAYREALELFDLVVEDTSRMTRDPRAWKLISQQVASADSVCANIEEGYGRWTRKDYAHFLVIARGSAQETKGRYLRLKHWLPKGTIEKRAGLCEEIIGILSSSIHTLKEPRVAQ
jgi:four helix bundle protein